jgi:hypothetical protein
MPRGKKRRRRERSRRERPRPEEGPKKEGRGGSLLRVEEMVDGVIEMFGFVERVGLIPEEDARRRYVSRPWLFARRQKEKWVLLAYDKKLVE